MQNLFQSSRDQYIRLRQQFSAGEISADQFDAALQALTLVDEQGRRWMLGANSGHWYYSADDHWIQAEPPNEAPPETPAPAPAGGSAARPWLATLVPLLFITVAGLIVVFAFATLQDGSSDNIALASDAGASLVTPQALASPQPTAALPIVAAASTSLPTATNAPTATNFPTTPVIQTPTRGFFVEPTQSTTPQVIPTVTAFGAVRSAPPSTVVGTDGSAPDQPVALVPTPVPAGIGSGVYVRSLQVSPNPARRRDSVMYTATFLNTTGQTQSFNWRIVVFDPNKPGRNKDWGQSNVVGIDVRPGQSASYISYVTVTNNGGCIPLQAVAGWQRRDNARMFFPNTDGNPLVASFQVC